MISIAYNLKEALIFFMENSSGNVLCVKDDGQEEEVSCYPEAEKFFEEAS